MVDGQLKVTTDHLRSGRIKPTLHAWRHVTHVKRRNKIMLKTNETLKPEPMLRCSKKQVDGTALRHDYGGEITGTYRGVPSRPDNGTSKN
jgi:hypothetical protein